MRASEKYPTSSMADPRSETLWFRSSDTAPTSRRRARERWRLPFSAQLFL